MSRSCIKVMYAYRSRSKVKLIVTCLQVKVISIRIGHHQGYILQVKVKGQFNVKVMY